MSWWEPGPERGAPANHKASWMNAREGSSARHNKWSSPNRSSPDHSPYVDQGAGAGGYYSTPAAGYEYDNSYAAQQRQYTSSGAGSKSSTNYDGLPPYFNERGTAATEPHATQQLHKGVGGQRGGPASTRAVLDPLVQNYYNYAEYQNEYRRGPGGAYGRGSAAGGKYGGGGGYAYGGGYFGGRDDEHVEHVPFSRPPGLSSPVDSPNPFTTASSGGAAAAAGANYNQHSQLQEAYNHASPVLPGAGFSLGAAGNHAALTSTMSATPPATHPDPKVAGGPGHEEDRTRQGLHSVLMPVAKKSPATNGTTPTASKADASKSLYLKPKDNASAQRSNSLAAEYLMTYPLLPDETCGLLGSVSSKATAGIDATGSKRRVDINKENAHFDAAKRQQRQSRSRDVQTAVFYDFVKMSSKEASFCLGRQGLTKRKLQEAAGCTIEIDPDRGIAECYSNVDIAAVKRAAKYLKFCSQQRGGDKNDYYGTSSSSVSKSTTVPLKFSQDVDNDLTLLRVPRSCAAFVTGGAGSFLRGIEEQFGTFMFYCELEGIKVVNKSKTSEDGTKQPEPVEYLAIFGTCEKSRKASALKIMGAVETKQPGYYLEHLDHNYVSDEFGFDVESRLLTNDEMSFCVGKEGATRKKLQKASNGAALEYVGLVAFIVGDYWARKRLSSYLQILLKQRQQGLSTSEPLLVADKNERDDCTVMKVPSTWMGLLKGQSLREIEIATDTFLLIEGDPDLSDCLLIFGGEQERHNAGIRVRELVQLPEGAEADGKEKKGGDPRGRLILVEVPLPALLLLERVEELLHKLRDQLSKLRITDLKIKDEALRVKVEQANAAQCALLCENFLNKDVPCEAPYYMPRGVPFSVLTAKAREGFRITRQEDGRLTKKIIRDAQNPLSYLDREKLEIFGVPIAGEHPTGELQPSSNIPPGSLPVCSILEDVRSRSRLRVRTFKDQRRVLLGGSLSQVLAAKRDLDLTLGDFMTVVLTVHDRFFAGRGGAAAANTDTAVGESESGSAAGEKKSMDKRVGDVVRAILPRMQYQHQLVAAKFADAKLTLSGSATAVEEAKKLTEEELLRLEAQDDEEEAKRKAANDTKPPPTQTQVVSLTSDNLKKLAKPKKSWADASCDGAMDDESGNSQSPVQEQVPPAPKMKNKEAFQAVETFWLLPHLRQGVLSREKSEPSSEWMRLPENDSAFILGRGGRTRLKISVVSGCRIDVHPSEEEGTEIIELTGTGLERRRARKYLDMIRVQRVGAVHVDDEKSNDRDLSTILVPHDCVGFVTGGGGSHLRACEAEFHTLMFFCDYHHASGRQVAAAGTGGKNMLVGGKMLGGLGGKGGGKHQVPLTVTNTRGYQTEERLVIFGQKRGQLGSKLKIMSAVETKMPGYFTKNRRADYIRGVQVKMVPADAHPALLNKENDSRGGGKGGSRGKGKGSNKMKGGNKADAGGAAEADDGVMLKKEEFTPLLSGADFGIDTMWVSPEGLSFALGANGVTRKKLCKSTNCILEFVGNIAHLGGNKRERRICRDYLSWLLCQREGVVGLEDLDNGSYSAQEFYDDTRRRARRKRKKKQQMLAERAATRQAKARSRSREVEDEVVQEGGAGAAPSPENNGDENNQVRAVAAAARAGSANGHGTENQNRKRDQEGEADGVLEHHSDINGAAENSFSEDYSEEDRHGDDFRKRSKQPLETKTLARGGRGRERGRFTHKVSREEYHDFVYEWVQDRDDIDVIFFYERCDLFSPQMLRQVEDQTTTYTFVDRLRDPHCLFVCGAFRAHRQRALDAVFAVLDQHGELWKTSWDSEERPEAGSACKIKAPNGPNKRHLSTAEKDLMIASGGASKIDSSLGFEQLDYATTRFEQRDLGFYTLLANRVRGGAAFYNEMRDEELIYNEGKDHGEDDHRHQHHRKPHSKDPNDPASKGGAGVVDLVELWQSPLPDLQVYQQPGPLGEDPVTEMIEQPKLKVGMLVTKKQIKLEGDAKAIRDAWRRLNAFAWKFEQVSILIKSGIEVDENLLKSVLSHYVQPLPWLSKAQVVGGDAKNAPEAPGVEGARAARTEVELVGHAVSLKKALRILEEYLGSGTFGVKTKPLPNPNKGIPASVAAACGSPAAEDWEESGGWGSSARPGRRERAARREERGGRGGWYDEEGWKNNGDEKADGDNKGRAKKSVANGLWCCNSVAQLCDAVQVTGVHDVRHGGGDDVEAVAIDVSAGAPEAAILSRAGAAAKALLLASDENENQGRDDETTDQDEGDKEQETVYIEGSRLARTFAKKYLDLVVRHTQEATSEGGRRGEFKALPRVELDRSDLDGTDEDLTLLPLASLPIVPATLSRGKLSPGFVKSLEKELAVLVFLVKDDAVEGSDDDQAGAQIPRQLAIFAPDPRARVAAVLRIYSILATDGKASRSLSSAKRAALQKGVQQMQTEVEDAVEKAFKTLNDYVIASSTTLERTKSSEQSRLERDELVALVETQIPPGVLSGGRQDYTFALALERVMRAAGCVAVRPIEIAQKILLVGSETERKRAKAYAEWTMGEILAENANAGVLLALKNGNTAAGGAGASSALSKRPTAAEAAKRKDCIVVRSSRKLWSSGGGPSLGLLPVGTTLAEDQDGHYIEDPGTDGENACLVFELPNNVSVSGGGAAKDPRDDLQSLKTQHDSVIEILNEPSSSASNIDTTLSLSHEIGIFGHSMRARVKTLLRLLMKAGFFEMSPLEQGLELCKQELAKSKRHAGAGESGDEEHGGGQNAAADKKSAEAGSWLNQYATITDYSTSSAEREARDTATFEFEGVRFSNDANTEEQDVLDLGAINVRKRLDYISRASGAFLEPITSTTSKIQSHNAGSEPKSLEEEYLYRPNGQVEPHHGLFIIGGTDAARKRCKEYLGFEFAEGSLCFRSSEGDEPETPLLPDLSVELRHDVVVLKNVYTATGAAAAAERHLLSETRVAAEATFGVITFVRDAPRGNEENKDRASRVRREKELLIFGAQYEARVLALQHVRCALFEHRGPLATRRGGAGRSKYNWVEEGAYEKQETTASRRRDRRGRDRRDRRRKRNRRARDRDRGRRRWKWWEEEEQEWDDEDWEKYEKKRAGRGYVDEKEDAGEKDFYRSKPSSKHHQITEFDSHEQEDDVQSDAEDGQRSEGTASSRAGGVAKSGKSKGKQSSANKSSRRGGAPPAYASSEQRRVPPSYAPPPRAPAARRDATESEEEAMLNSTPRGRTRRASPPGRRPDPREEATASRRSSMRQSGKSGGTKGKGKRPVLETSDSEYTSGTESDYSFASSTRRLGHGNQALDESEDDSEYD